MILKKYKFLKHAKMLVTIVINMESKNIRNGTVRSLTLRPADLKFPQI